MKSTNTSSRVVIAVILLAIAIVSCKSVAPPPSAPHSERVNTAKWN